MQWKKSYWLNMMKNRYVTLKKKNIISNMLGSIFLNIHHVGSTAVPDLLAKPIIDIGIESAEFPLMQHTIQLLSQLDYQYRGEAGVKGRIWFTKGHPRKFNMHVCAAGSDVIKKQIIFKERLRCNEQLRRDYETIKLQNYKGKSIDDAQYAFSKTDLIKKSIEYKVHCTL